MHSQRHLPMGKHGTLRERAVPLVIACSTAPFPYRLSMWQPLFNLEVVGTVLSVPVILSFVNPRPRKRRTRPPCGPSRFVVLVLDYSLGFESSCPSCFKRASGCHFAFSPIRELWHSYCGIFVFRQSFVPHQSQIDIGWSLLQALEPSRVSLDNLA